LLHLIALATLHNIKLGVSNRLAQQSVGLLTAEFFGDGRDLETIYNQSLARSDPFTGLVRGVDNLTRMATEFGPLLQGLRKRAIKSRSHQRYENAYRTFAETMLGKGLNPLSTVDGVSFQDKALIYACDGMLYHGFDPNYIKQLLSMVKRGLKICGSPVHIVRYQQKKPRYTIGKGHQPHTPMS